MRTLLLLLFCTALVSTAYAQSDTLALDPAQFVNAQILADQASGSPHAVYSVESGQAYAFDGRLDLTFPVEIVGPDNGWIKDDPNPPIPANTPDEQGDARQFFDRINPGLHRKSELSQSGKSQRNPGFLQPPVCPAK